MALEGLDVTEMYKKKTPRGEERINVLVAWHTVITEASGHDQVLPRLVTRTGLYRYCVAPPPLVYRGKEFDGQSVCIIKFWDK